MDVEAFFQFIKVYGISTAILVFVIIWLRSILNQLFSIMFEELREAMFQGKENAKEALVKAEQAEMEAKRARMKHILDLNDKVMSCLRATLAEFKASRVYVFCYHNGGKNLIGFDFAKTSCTHEVVALGVRPQQPTLQNLPVTFVWAFIKSILAGVGIICPSIETCFKDTDSSMYETLRVQNIKSVYCFGLYEDDNTPIGFFGVDYVDEEVTLTAQEIDHLKTIGVRLSTLLCMAGHPFCNLATSNGEAEVKIYGLDEGKAFQGK